MSTGQGRPPFVPEDYDLTGMVGQGRISSVYRAVHRASGHPVALKVWGIPPEGLTPDQHQAFAHAWWTMHDLSGRSPHLVEYRHAGTTAGHPWLAMDVYDHSWADTAAGSLPLETALTWAEDLLTGLAAMHAAGRAHGAVSPANVLIRAGRATLAEPAVAGISTPLPDYVPADGRAAPGAPSMPEDLFAAARTVLAGLPAGAPAAVLDVLQAQLVGGPTAAGDAVDLLNRFRQARTAPVAPPAPVVLAPAPVAPPAPPPMAPPAVSPAPPPLPPPAPAPPLPPPAPAHAAPVAPAPVAPAPVPPAAPVAPAPVAAAPAGVADRLVVEHAAGAQELTGRTEWVIGRSREADVQIVHEVVGRRHAQVRLEGGHWYVVDLNSLNGLWHGGVRVERVPITEAGVVVQLGGDQGPTCTVRRVGAHPGLPGGPLPAALR